MLSKNDTWIIYTGDGEATEFAYPFTVHNADEVCVALVGENSLPIKLEADYYVDTEKGVVLYPGYADGEEPAESEQPAVLTSDDKILIYRATPATQLTQLDSHWPFSSIEQALDKNTMIEQEILDILKRCLKISAALSDMGIKVTTPWNPKSAFKWSEDGSRLVLMMSTEDALAIVKGWVDAIWDRLKELAVAISLINGVSPEELLALIKRAENAAMTNVRWPMEEATERDEDLHNWELDTHILNKAIYPWQNIEITGDSEPIDD